LIDYCHQPVTFLLLLLLPLLLCMFHLQLLGGCLAVPGEMTF
jgi:hypothetical protein